jgi:hypothetical protein
MQSSISQVLSQFGQQTNILTIPGTQVITRGKKEHLRPREETEVRTPVLQPEVLSNKACLPKQKERAPQDHGSKVQVKLVCDT